MSTDDTKPTTGTSIQKRPPAELVSRPTTSMERASSRGRREIYGIVRRSAGRVVPGSRTRTVLRWLVRNGLIYPLVGVWVLTRRGWEARTHARYERQLRAAEAAGDQDRLDEWEARAEQARERRHRRRMDWITAPLDLARTAAALLLSAIGGLLGLGAVLAIAHSDLRGCSPRSDRPWRRSRGWCGCST